MPDPLDMLMRLALGQSWSVDRTDVDSIEILVQGRWCRYIVGGLWHDDLSALQLACRYDAPVTIKQRSAIERTCHRLNERAWFGHFRLEADSGQVVFAHTVLLNGLSRPSRMRLVQEALEMMLGESERAYPALFATLQGQQAASLDLALQDVQGIA